MKSARLWALVGTGLLLILGAGLWSLPFARTEAGPLPQPLNEHRILLERGMVLRQTLTLPTPPPRDVALRVWVQRIVPADQPFLKLRGESDGQVLGEMTLPLAPADGALHVRQAPWWRLPAEAQSMTLVVEGHGMWIAAMSADDVAGGDLEVNGVSRAPGDLAIQLVSGDLGIERYLPMTRIAEGKPGPLAWPRYSLVLLLIYVLAVVRLVASIPRLVHSLQSAALLQADPAADDTRSRAR
jgi:hypothetical protein